MLIWLCKITGVDITNKKKEDAGPILGDRLRLIMQDLEVPDGLTSLGYTKDDIPNLVKGTMPQVQIKHHWELHNQFWLSQISHEKSFTMTSISLEIHVKLLQMNYSKQILGSRQNHVIYTLTVKLITHGLHVKNCTISCVCIRRNCLCWGLPVLIED